MKAYHNLTLSNIYNSNLNKSCLLYVNILNIMNLVL